MKTRHTRLFASVSAAALIGITALTPMATAQGVVVPETGTTTTNSNTPWEMNWYNEQVNDIVSGLEGLGFNNPTGDLGGLFEEIQNYQEQAGGDVQSDIQRLLNILSDFVDLPSHTVEPGGVYNENGELHDRYEFYYGEDGVNTDDLFGNYGWDVGDGVNGEDLDSGDEVGNEDEVEDVDSRYKPSADGNYHLDTDNNDFPVNGDGEPIEAATGTVIDTTGQQFDRDKGQWVSDEEVTNRLQSLARPQGEPLFLDTLNYNTIVKANAQPVSNEWNTAPDGQLPDRDPVPTPGEGGPTGGKEDGSTGGKEDGPEQEVVSELPDPAEGSEWEPVDDNEDRVTDGTDFYERVEDDEGNESWVRVDENGNPLDENGDPLDENGNPLDENGDPLDETGNDETTDNPLDGLDVTVEDGRIQVSFPVDLAGNPHTLTASLDAKNGFTVALTPGNESSTGNGSSNQDDDSAVISDPEVTPVYIDANGNTYPARYDEDGNIVPPKNLADGTYRLGFEIQGEDGDPVIVGTDYNVKVGDGAMTEAKNDEGGGVVNVDNKTDKDKDDDKDKGKNGGSSNNSSSANFKPAVSNLESLGAGGGTDVGGGGTDSDATSMQNSGDNSSNRTSRNASNDSNAANAASPASYDNGVQTHASSQENLAETGTNTNTLMVMVGGLLMAAAGVLLVGRRKGWV